MRPTRILSAAALTLVLFAVGCAQSASGSQPPTTTSGAQTITAGSIALRDSGTIIFKLQDPLDELKKQALIIAENKKLREQVTGLEQERDALIGQRESALGLAKKWQEIAGEWQTAATQRKSAVETSVKLDTNQQADLARAESEIARTRALLDECRNPGFLKSIFKTDTLWKVGGGILIGKTLP